MKNGLSWKDVLPASILAGLFLLRFDVLMALVVFIATASGVYAVRKHFKQKQ